MSKRPKIVIIYIIIKLILYKYYKNNYAIVAINYIIIKIILYNYYKTN